MQRIKGVRPYRPDANLDGLVNTIHGRGVFSGPFKVKILFFKIFLSKFCYYLRVKFRFLPPFKISHKKNAASKRKIRPVVIYALIVIAILVPVIYIVNNRATKSEAAWWDDSWSYRQRIPITNSGSAQTDYEISFTLNTSSLITAGKLQSDCDDIRVVGEDGKVLPVWVQEDVSNCNTSSTKIWTKIPSISTDPMNIYVYYGNPTTTGASDGNGVFMFFDDFDSNRISDAKWDEQDSGATVSVSSGIATFTTSSSSDYYWISSKNLLTSPYWVESYVSSHSSANPGGAVLRMGQSSGKVLRSNGNYYNEYSIDDNLNTYRIVGDDSGSGYSVTSTTTSNTSGVWRFSWPATGTQLFYLNDASTLTGGHSTVSASSNTYIYVGSPANSTTGSVSISWILGRKYASTEPSVGTLGTEEQSSGPLIYYKFNEGTGTTTNDSSGNGANGTLSNGPVWSSNSLCLTEACLYFDGSDDQVDTGKDYSWSSSQSFGLSVWVKPTSISGNRTIFGKGLTGSTWEYSLKLTNATPNFTYWNTSGGGEISLSSSETIDLNTWNHLVVTYNGSTAYLYLNGKVVSTDTAGGTFQNRANNIIIGRAYFNSGASGAFQGYIDEFKVYNYARSAAEVQKDYLSGLASSSTPQGSSAILGGGGIGNLTSGLVGYWKFDDWSSGIPDSSGIGNSGSVTNDTASTTTSKFGLAANFDGTDDKILIPDSSAYDFPDNSFSIATWFKTPNTATSRGIFYLISDGGYFYININSSEAVVLETGDSNGTSISVTSTTTYSDAAWHQITVVRDAVNKKLLTYIDGVNIISVDDTRTGNFNPSSFVQLVIGGGYNLTTFEGQLDDFRIYNRALSGNEASQLYSWAPGPVGYWNLDDGTGTSALDISGNSSTGTLTNGPTWTNGKVGKGVNFDGSDDYISIGDVSALNTSGSVSASAWIYLNNTTGVKSIGGRWGTGASDHSYKIAVLSGKFYIDVSGTGSGDNYRQSNTTLSTGTWYHVEGVYTAGSSATLDVYVNGKLDNGTLTGTVPSSLFTGASTARIGTDTTNYFNGVIDEFRVYNYARSQKQILQDFNFDHPSVGTPIGATLLHYKFDEGYGATTYDSSPSGLNGTLGAGTSAPTWSNDGKFVKALTFDGSNDYVNGGTSTNLNLTGPFTITAWAKRSASSSYDTILQRYAESSPFNGYALRYSNGVGEVNKLCFWTGGASGTWLCTSKTITDTSWHYLTAVWDGTTRSVYIDGVKYASDTQASALSNSSDTLYIGAIGSSPVAADFGGTMDEVKIYPFALTEDEIKIDYNNGKVAVMGSTGTTSAGIADNSALREYCVPGDSSSCSAPVGEWKMDEGTGSGTDAVKDTASTNHGDTQGSMTNANWVPGHFGNALRFDGVDDLVTLGTGSTLAQTGSLTLSAWINYNQPTGNYYIISKYRAVSGKRGYALLIIDSKLQFILGTAADGATSFTSTGSVPTNEWAYVAGVIGADNVMRLYINGILDSTQNYSGTRQASTTDVQIGAYGDSGLRNSYFPGMIDNVRIYNTNLSQAQIAWEYNKGKPIGHYKLDECEGTTAYNSAFSTGAAPGRNGDIDIGASGSQTAAGTCSTSGAWYNGSTGKINSSLYFDGTDDEVNIPDDANYDFSASQDFTVAIWMNASSSQVTSTSSFFEKWDATGGYPFALRFSSGSIVAARYDGTNNPSITSTSAIYGDDNWHHIVFAKIGSTLYLYIDGRLDGTATDTTTGTTANSFPLYIGNRGSVANRHFTGKLDEAMVFNYGLTSQLVRTLYNSGAAAFK